MSSRPTGSTSAQPSDITIEEMHTFFGLVIQMGHDQRHSLKDYWSREEQYCTSFYSNVMARDRFFHILWFLHFENNDNPPNHDNPDYDRLWKIWKIFDILNNKFCELYNPTEQLAVDEVIVLYKGRVVFQQYIPKKHKRFGIKIYKLCDSLGYTYDMSMYLDKQRQHATAQITVLQLIRRVEGLGQKIIMDNYFTSPALFDNLFQRKINACGTDRHDRRGMPRDIGPKSLKMKRGDIVTRVRGPKEHLLERQAGCVHSDKHACSPCWRKFHPWIWPGYQTSCCGRLQCIHGVCGQVRQNGQQLWNCPQSMEVDQETVFHLTDMAILNTFLTHKSCGSKMTHKKFPWNSRSRICYSFARRKCDS